MDRWWALLRHRRDYIPQMRDEVERGVVHLLRITRGGEECGALALLKVGSTRTLEIVGLAGQLGGGVHEVAQFCEGVAAANCCTRIWLRTWRRGLRREMARRGYVSTGDTEMVLNLCTVK